LALSITDNIITVARGRMCEVNQCLLWRYARARTP